MTIDVKITTDAATEPITLSEAKAYLRVDTSTEDALITDCITAARKYVEKYTGKSFTAKTLSVVFGDLWKADEILELPYPPIASITSVHEVDEEGTETELTLNVDYYKRGQNNIEITGVFDKAYQYKAIYTTSASEADDLIKFAMLKLVADYYENRQNEKEEGSFKITYDTLNLLSSYRKNVWRL